MKHLLLIEDDNALSTGIKMAMEGEGYKVTVCCLLREARRVLESISIDLVILDLNLPDGNGLGFIKEIKRKRDIPLIVLTAMDLETDVVAGFSMGADDYVTKPFSLAILKARIEAQLRKLAGMGEVELGVYRFDFAAHRYFKHDENIELSQTEEKILFYLVKHRGNTVCREQLEGYVWGSDGNYLDTNSLSVAVKRLRMKLKDTGRIKTVYGIGYTWEE